MMCAPVIAAAALASTAISAYGAISQGNATAKADNYNAQQGLIQAQSANTAARINEQQTYRVGDQLEGRAEAAQGANGVVVNSGTALSTRADIQAQTNRNVADQTYGASTATYGALTQAGLLKAEGQQAQSASLITTGSTILGGASQVASKWGGF